MSKFKKEKKAEKRAIREAMEGRRVVAFVAGTLFILFVMILIAYSVFY